MKRLVKNLRMFHGRGVRKIRDFDFTLPKGFIVLGKVRAVEYITDKHNGGGDGTTAIYRHTFETPAYICADENCKRQLYILGEKVKVTRDGIEN